MSAEQSAPETLTRVSNLQPQGIRSQGKTERRPIHTEPYKAGILLL